MPQCDYSLQDQINRAEVQFSDDDEYLRSVLDLARYTAATHKSMTGKYDRLLLKALSQRRRSYRRLRRLRFERRRRDNKSTRTIEALTKIASDHRQDA